MIFCFLLDDFDAIMGLTDTDMLENNGEISSEMDSVLGNIMDDFKSITMPSTGDVLPAYNLMSPIVVSFHEYAQKFYPQFFKVLQNPWW